MPFTISHAAVAWPCTRLPGARLVTSAVVLGSMAPDAEYLLRLRPTGKLGHSLAGLWVFCLPIGLVAVWLWEGLIARELRALVPLPAAIAPPARAGSGRRLLDVSISVLIGAASHIGWDHLTHDWGWPVQRWATLRRPVPMPGVGTHPLYALLQQGSSCLGLVVLGLWGRPALGVVLDGLAGSDVASRRRRRVWLLLAATSVAGATLNGVSCRWRLAGACSARRAVSFGLVGGMAASVVWATLLSLTSFVLRRAGIDCLSTSPQPRTCTNTTPRRV